MCIRDRDEEPHVLDRHDVVELRDGGTRDGRDRLAGRIRDEMQMQSHARGSTD